jgi:hypothetical protein
MSQHQLTAQIAYEIFVQRGRVRGRQAEDWRAAETIVALCLAFAVELARAAAPEVQIQPRDPGPLHERALALLQTAVAESGRASVASSLGYKSPSSVGRYLRGDRAIGEKLAKRIVAALAQANAPRLRRAA